MPLTKITISILSNTYRVSQKKGINKNFFSKLLTSSIQRFCIYFQIHTGCPKRKVSIKTFFRSCSLLQFRDFVFILSVSFVWCIICKIWVHLGSFTAVFQRRTCFLAFKFSRKTAIKFQKCFCVTLLQKFVTDCHLE